MKQATKALTLGLVALVCLFFTNARTHADTIYVSNSGNNTIMKFDSSGHRSVFANTGLSSPSFIAVQVPEPATWAMVVLGTGVLLGSRGLRHRSS